MADQLPLHPRLCPSNGWPPFNPCVGNFGPPRGPQLTSVSGQQSKPPGGRLWIIWSSCHHARNPPSRVGCWLMRGERPPFPSTSQIRLLTVQTALLLGRWTTPKMPHIQKQPRIGHLKLLIGLLGWPLWASLDPPPQCPVAPCCNPHPLLLAASSSLCWGL